MFSRRGLRFRMAVSYVLISAVAVLLAEGLTGGLIVTFATREIILEQPGIASMAQRQAEATAAADATALGLLVAAESGVQSDLTVMAGRWLRQTAQAQGSNATTTVRAVAGTDGRLLLASQPPAYLAGSVPQGLPTGLSASSGMILASGPPIGWAVRPVLVGGRSIGVVYVQAQDNPRTPPDLRSSVSWSIDSSGWLLSGVLTFLLLVPLCVISGLLSTRLLISRIQRLAAGAAAMAAGDKGSRVQVSGGDEITRLEDGFNVMAGRVEAASRTEQVLAGARAERAERTRIARELHDSISQDLFSLGLVATSLRRKLPDGSRFQEQARVMEQTIEHTMREMRTMLLQLRPVALEETGLVPALRELCQAYQVRLGIAVHAELDEVELEPDAEHTVLRIVQEALGNAARHGGAQAIDLRLAEADGLVEVLVRDDGRGFDPEQANDRHGMGLAMMRERIIELGGTLSVTSAPERGTTVRARIPARAGGAE